MKHNISIVIPVYKEEKRITRCIEESLFFFRNNPKINHFELLFVADKSGDKSIDIIQKYLPNNKEIKLILNETRQQKGGSVKIGVLETKYPIILYYDTDLSTPLYEINPSLDLLQDYDIVIGSRGLKESHVEKKIQKTLLSKGFSVLKYMILGLSIKDTQCGFKMFRASTRSIFKKQRIKSSCFDVEFLYLAQKWGFSIKEKPITWIDSDMSNFNTLQIVPSFVKELFEIRLNALRGYYDA